MQHWVREVLEDAISTRGALDESTRSGLLRIAEIIEGLDIYVFRTVDLEEIADALANCARIPDLSQLIGVAAHACGFDFATVFLIRQGSSTAFQTRICTSYPGAWIQRYGEKNYQFIDPVLARASEASQPFRFTDVDDRMPVLRRFWEDAEAHGVGREGLAVGFDVGSGTRIGVSFASAGSVDDVQDVIRLNGQDAVGIARIAAEAFAYLGRGVPPSASSLTAAELRFLHVLVTAERPEITLSEMPAFGTNAGLQGSILSKLGVKSISQAAALASANNWFDEMPWEAGDVSQAFENLSGRAIAALTSR